MSELGAVSEELSEFSDGSHNVELSVIAADTHNDDVVLIQGEDDTSVVTSADASAMNSAPLISDSVPPPVLIRPRTRRPKAAAPIYTSEVRHSQCSNKFNSFKIHDPKDTHAAPSKVKPRLMPSIGSSSSTPRIDDAVPPPTSIAMLQEIGVHRCAIPAVELTSEALLATPSVASQSDVHGQSASSSLE